MNWKADCRVLLAVTGGIAAYKTPNLARLLVKSGVQLKAVMSEHAEQFVTPLSLSVAGGHMDVFRQKDFLDQTEGAKIPHIQLAQWADAILIAPATASHLARLACGDGDSLIAALCLATTAPVLVCPAMNTKMYRHPATQKNIQVLKELGYGVLQPDCGHLACGDQGEGRLPDEEVILSALWPILSPNKTLKGKKVVITAGPTREYLDPVRFISNPSTGKMGLALAAAARDRGADVTLLWGPCSVKPPYGVTLCPFTTADDLLALAQKHIDCDIFIAAAAVGDYKAAEYSEHKLKREKLPKVQREFVRNPDIAAWVGEHKKDSTILVGFAAETDDLISNAKGKMERKKLDYIVANDVSNKQGFCSDQNQVILIGSTSQDSFGGTKEDVACWILDRLIQ